MLNGPRWFKPNQSGNPEGRPRRSPTLRTIVEKVLEELIAKPINALTLQFK